MKKVFIIIGSIFVVFILSIPIGLWVDVHQNYELSNKYPNPKKILVDYVAYSGCVPFVDDISIMIIAKEYIIKTHLIHSFNQMNLQTFVLRVTTGKI